MEYDNEIRDKIRMDMPKLILFDGPEYEKLQKKYLASVYNNKDVFMKILSIQLQYEDTDELFVNNNISRRMMVFFLNYLQNENLIKGEELSKKLYMGFINIKSYDENGNLEYDTMESFQQYLFLPNYIDEIFNEIILMVMDLGRWCCIYINKQQKIGQFFDFKKSDKIDSQEQLEVLNEIIQAEFRFNIADYDIRVLQQNVNVDCDGSYFIVNLLYKLIQGVPLERLDFSAKEKEILKIRLDWLILKTKDMQESQQVTKKGFKNNMNEEEDIILDKTLQEKQSKSNNQNRSLSQASYKKMQYDDRVDDSQNDSMLITSNNKINSRKPTIFMNKGRQKTKVIPMHQNNLNTSQDNLQESFDYRNELKVKPNKQQQYQQLDVSYQESVNENLKNIWNLPQQQANQKSNLPLKKYNQAEEELNSLWNLKKQFKKGLRQRHNQPVLIPEEHKHLYQEKNEQPSQLRNFQDKVVDIITFLDSPDNKDIQESPIVQQALQRLKQQLGIKSKNISKKEEETDGDEDDQSETNSQQNGLKTKNVQDLKKILKQRMLENATGNLDALLEKQKILNDILDYDVEERKDLEMRFESEIKKIDSRFQEYMQKYDAMNQYESLQSIYRNSYHGPPDYEISQMKNSMHLELQNYLLSGLGLPSKFSNNPFFQQQKDPMKNSILSNNQASSLQNSQVVPQFNQKIVNQNSSKNGQILKNNSMINLNSLQEDPLFKKNQKENKQSDIIAQRYNAVVTKKNLVDALTQDRLEENVINFLLGYLEEKYYLENSRSIMTRDENRIMLFPVNFYSELTQNSPLVKQHQLNYQEVSNYTKNFMNKHTIFDEFDKLIFPIKISKPQLFTLVVVDINVRQIIYFPILKNLNLDYVSADKQNSLNNSDNQSDISNIHKNPIKNPISLNILKYLEKEYSVKCMKNFQILNWSLTNVSCSQTSSPALSAYYMIIYITMIFEQQYNFLSITNNSIKQFKLWMPEVFKTVGITNNQVGDIKFFVSQNK
ncbi:hypothetical protein TTHERM_00721360 (macronuclear) [Tetrahymena thermophila SB210]|uniref:Ubiquitin-like protease family profile domain-containing protein n=1 Tax=Tetrahymena thermophila (strain SB210) TaxID=312017 RepID=Q22G21_TETTS|nr:hypothetical protein TTHERM_00721360 [Tetrahymena thermophila SB210]EAR84205.1 hypothetical protein TTHERM_00721360 [Tetrahymena thermophila SB210]|eukprot:XP_001031868.1 hypothetical protein TTHERM_00721360 [Tetrahymena thermophila SB210]